MAVIISPCFWKGSEIFFLHRAYPRRLPFTNPASPVTLRVIIALKNQGLRRFVMELRHSKKGNIATLSFLPVFWKFHQHFLRIPVNKNSGQYGCLSKVSQYLRDTIWSTWNVELVGASYLRDFQVKTWCSPKNAGLEEQNAGLEEKNAGLEDNFPFQFEGILGSSRPFSGVFCFDSFCLLGTIGSFSHFHPTVQIQQTQVVSLESGYAPTFHMIIWETNEMAKKCPIKMCELKKMLSKMAKRIAIKKRWGHSDT